MSSYSVVYWTPSRPMEERVNFGVVAWSDDKLAYKFVEDWQHVERFAEGQSIEFLQEFASTFGEQFSTGKEIEYVSENWYYGVLQFTRPRASTLSVDDLLEDMFPRFVWTPSEKEE